MFGRCTVQGAVLRGAEAIPVDVEVAVTQGLPGFSIVGMPDAAVQEAKDRVRVALRAAGYAMPDDRVLVNLAPSSLRKTGSGFDYAIAVGLLVATGQIDPELARESLYVGELSLDGGVRPVAGILAYALCARDLGLAISCSVDADDFVALDGLRQRGVSSLKDLREPNFWPIGSMVDIELEPQPDFREVSGNEVAKRAMQIAAAGSHGVLMMGPPGSGKTMLASRLPSILPPLTEEEALEVALIHSIAGESTAEALARRRPFRAPHHSATGPGLIGGGSPVRPGEISLAHLGVAFFDELAEFKMSVLQQLRQPLEQGFVSISRADGCVVFPSRFMFVAASNPCPCGYFGDPEHECKCSAKQITDYQNRIGGPLMDRIDMHIDVARVPPKDVLSHEGGISSEELREGVMAGREYASWREAVDEGKGARSSTQRVIASCKLEEADERFFEKMARANHMSGRAIVRTLSVARTIADIAQRKSVNKADLCEAIGLRIRDGVGR